MPRRKANDRTGPVKTRSREGCSECRASRVRCDTKKPSCTRCQERGLQCSTKVVLKWESEFASRGQAFGRAGVWSKSKAAGSPSTPSASGPNAFLLGEQEWCFIPQVEAWNFVNSSTDAFRLPYRVTPTEDDHALVTTRRSRVVSSPYESGSAMVQLAAPLPSLSVLPQFSGSVHGHLFEYYVQRICPRTIASANTPSPLASIIIPFCSTASETVSKAILALGACALSLDNPEYYAVGLRLKSEALRGLRHRLTASGSLVSTSDPEILVVMMLLCLYELVDHCDQRWIVHLKGAKELIRFRRQQAALPAPQQDDAPEQDEVTSFAERFFAFQDIMGRTACGEQPLFGTDYWQHNERRIDHWMGCSPELVSILSDITELSRTRRRLASKSDKDEFSSNAAALNRRLEELVQDVDEDDAALQAIAELKRLAAVLYLHCALNNASPTTPLVVDYVRKILKLVSDMLDAGTYVGLAWPVFVAAVELDSLNDELWKDDDGNVVFGRPLVLRALAAMAEFNILSVARTRAVIVKVWQVRDNVLTLPLGDASDNDWECYVAPFSTAMSLA
ncbi:Zn(II)2Cys6 transcription factor [Aspergillus mulundensis]|uniref:Putative Zn(II)2Cys6 transcription factor n=1 Tax=Aspergillus mulundensis TaxID=1810919 RepID=A0A3D8RXP4_9EURO|nr:putative Zn(II)2Cys6 transcription factor [Aspergillus mulundensis]RDW78591.1 putative Zn(II)2Cys6 transcription factor [Aspergillus mulundensis]